MTVSVQRNKLEDVAKTSYFRKQVVRASRSDRDALAYICNTIARDVLYALLHSLPNNVSAEDTAQKILIRVCEEIHTLARPRTFKVWLDTIISSELNIYLSKKVTTHEVIEVDEIIHAHADDSNIISVT